MRIRNILIAVALVAAPIASVAVTYYGPIWFLKAEIGKATEFQWNWMVRFYGVPPPMEDCLDRWGEPPQDWWSLYICAGTWIFPPAGSWPVTSKTDHRCWDLYRAAEDHLISVAVALDNARPGDPYYEPLDLQRTSELSQVALEDLLTFSTCLEGEPIGGFLERRGR